MPNVTFHHGAAVGAQSLVNESLDVWSLNAGVPSRLIGERDKDDILELERMFKSEFLNDR